MGFFAHNFPHDDSWFTSIWWLDREALILYFWIYSRVGVSRTRVNLSGHFDHFTRIFKSSKSSKWSVTQWWTIKYYLNGNNYNLYECDEFSLRQFYQKMVRSKMDGHEPWIISDTFDFNHVDRIGRALLDHSFWTWIKNKHSKTNSNLLNLKGG